jgi:peptidoglycan/LPS O-acetylase OafA/YrhL
MTKPSVSQPDELNIHPRYRADIDGLRAVAILSVVGFHAFPFKVPGGFIGVDIFFVISGYLISTIIFRSLQRGDFSFAEFYAHRIKRIFPALIVVLMACYAFGWFALLPDEFRQLGKHMAAGAGFVQNFIIWQEVGYFDTVAELKPLLHLWSLAIEEQFYLIYPVLIFAAWRTGFNVLTLVVLLGSISFGLNISGIVENPTDTFFLPQTRFWELQAGSVLAFVQLFKRAKLYAWMQLLIFHPLVFRHPPQPERRSEVLNNILSAVGLLLIFCAMIFINKSKPFPGCWALLPVSGAFLLILSGPEAWVNRVILANKLMVFFGTISYPLYLWHWPILSFVRIVESGIPSRDMRIGAVILSFVLAWLTYRFLEKPIRFGKSSWIKTATLTFVLAVISYVGYNAFQRNGLEFRTKQFDRITKAAGEWAYPGKLVVMNREGVFDYYLQQSGRRMVTLFVGDSNVEQYFPRVEALISKRPEDTNGIIFKTGGGCLPIPDQQYDGEHKHCSRLMLNALRIAKEKPEVDTVVIAGQWNGYLDGGWGLTKKFGAGSAEYVDALSKLGEYIQELRALNKRVFLVLNIPTGTELDPKYMAKRDLKSFPRILSVRIGGIPKVGLEKAYGRIQGDLAHMARDAGAIVINPMDSLCMSACSGVDAEGEPMYKDAAHLRPAYVRENADFIDVTVR